MVNVSGDSFGCAIIQSLCRDELSGSDSVQDLAGVSNKSHGDGDGGKLVPQTSEVNGHLKTEIAKQSSV